MRKFAINAVGLSIFMSILPALAGQRHNLGDDIFYAKSIEIVKISSGVISKSNSGSTYKVQLQQSLKGALKSDQLNSDVSLGIGKQYLVFVFGDPSNSNDFIRSAMEVTSARHLETVADIHRKKRNLVFIKSSENSDFTYLFPGLVIHTDKIRVTDIELNKTKSICFGSYYYLSDVQKYISKMLSDNSMR